MTYGRSSTAPCGHPGEHVIGQYVRCLSGCDAGKKPTIVGTVLSTYYTMKDGTIWHIVDVRPGDPIPPETMRTVAYEPMVLSSPSDAIRYKTFNFTVMFGGLMTAEEGVNEYTTQHILAAWLAV